MVIDKPKTGTLGRGKIYYGLHVAMTNVSKNILWVKEYLKL